MCLYYVFNLNYNIYIIINYKINHMNNKVIKNEDTLNSKNHNEDNIYLITQYFIPLNENRRNEIRTCLKKNIELNIFKKIFLINEKKYTKDEMGLTDNEMSIIQQIIFDKGERMKFMHCLGVIKKLNINSYFVIANSDIFFDDSLNNVRKTSLSQEKSLYALLRFEFNERKLRDCKIFGPRSDSQDTWILHSKFLPSDDKIIRCNFYLGAPGCDNSIAFLFDKFGYKIYNEPYIIKTYHYHNEKFRNKGYNVDRILSPYLCIEPIIRKLEEPIIRKLEEPKIEEPKIEEPKIEESKIEEPKIEEPKIEEPKIEEPKIEDPKL